MSDFDKCAREAAEIRFKSKGEIGYKSDFIAGAQWAKEQMQASLDAMTELAAESDTDAGNAQVKLERYEKALKQIKSKSGLCIYGAPETSGDPDVAFRQGSHYAFSDCAEIATEALEGEE